MEPNPIVRFFRWLFPPESATSGRRCEAGHAMDPSWVTCPYCRAESSVHGQSPRSRTRVDHPEDPEAAAHEDVRRLTGVLVTFSWRREGELFPLYEGKNLIGSGSTAADRRRCDVRITKDSTLSREHALIRCIGEVYEIFDEKSENGTFMNDEPVPVNGMPLKDRARMRTGATVWTFLAIRPPATSERQSRVDEGKKTGDKDLADRLIEEAEGSTEDSHRQRRPTTVPYPDEKPPAREGRRPTTFFEPAESEHEREERAARESEDAAVRRARAPEATPVQPEEELPHRRPKDKTKVIEPDEPAARGKDDRTKFV